MTGEKRERERIPLAGHLRGEVMVFEPMTILDLSQAGAKIEIGTLLPAYSQHEFRLSFGHRSIIVKGRIAYCHIGELTDAATRYRAGVEFVELSSPAVSAIADFVSAIRYSRSAADEVRPGQGG